MINGNIASPSSTSGAGTKILAVSGNGNTIINGVLSKGGATFLQLTKTGNGTLTLTGNNTSIVNNGTFNGTTTLNAGTLAISNNTALGTGALTFAAANTGTLDALLNNMRITNNQTLTGNGTYNVGSGLTFTNGGLISSVGRLTKTGAGVMVLTNANTYSGGTTLSAGQLNINNDAALGSGAFTIAGGSIDNTSGTARNITNAINLNADTTFVGSGNLTQTTGAIALDANRQITVSSNTLSLGGVISGSGRSLTKAGGGMLSLTSSNSFSGGLSISAGVLGFTVTGALGSGAVTNNATLLYSGSGDSTISNDISGSGALNVSSGTLNLTSSNNSYLGGSTIGSGATLTLTNGGALGTGAIVNAGTLNLGNATGLTLATNITGNGAINITSGVVTAASGANAFAGTTTLSGGAFNVGSGASFSNGAVIASGGTLTGAGTLGATTLNAGSTVNVSGGTSAGTLTVGNLTINGGTFAWNLFGATGDLISAAGVTFANSSYTISVNNAVGSDWNSAVSTNYTILTGSSYSGYDAANFTVNQGNAGGAGKWTISSDVSSGLMLVYTANSTEIFVTSPTGVTTLQSVATNTVFADGGGPTPVVMDGAGEYVLNMSNTYSGSTTIGSGTLTAQNNASFGTSAAIYLGTSSNAASNAAVNINTAGVTVGAVITVQGSGSNVIANSSGGEVTYTGGVNLDSNATVMNADGGNLVLSGGGINGGGALGVNAGTGTVTLSAANSYTGGTALNGGTLAVGNNTALGTGTLSVSTNATLQAAASVTLANNASVTGGQTLTLDAKGNSLGASGSISGGGGVAVTSSTGGGTVTLSGSNSYTGASSVNNGTLRLGNINALPSVSSLTVGNVGTLDLNGNNATVGGLASGGSGAVITNSGSAATFTLNTTLNNTFAGTITGLLGLSKGGAGIFTLSGANGYTGTTTINGGTLEIGGSGRLGGGSYSTNIAIASGATFAVNSSANQTLGGVISGTGSMSKGSSGTLTLNGANTYSGGTTINGGTVVISTSNNLGTNIAANTITFGGGTLTLSNSADATFNNNLSIASNTASAINATGNRARFSGTLSGSGTLTTLGTQWIDITGSAAGFNNGGTLNKEGNRLNLGSTAGSANATYILNGTGGTYLQNSGSSATWNFGSLSGSDILYGNQANVVVSVGNLNSNDVYSGQIREVTAGSHTLSLAKVGSGTLTLSGANTYAGGTTLSGGSLRVANQNALVNSTLTMGGGTLVFDSAVTGRAFTFGGLAATTAGAGYDIGLTNSEGNGINLTVGGNNAATTYAGALSGSGTLTKAGNGALTLSASNSYTGGTLLTAGTLIVNNNNALGSGTVTLSNGAQLYGNGDYRTIANAIALGQSGVGSINGVNGGGYGRAFWVNGGLSGGTDSTLTLVGNMVGISGDASQFFGTLNVNAAQAFYSASLSNAAVVISTDGNYLGWGGSAFQLGSLSGSGQIGGNQGGASVSSLTLGYLGSNSTYSGVINVANGGGFTKVGGGTQTLTGNTTYTGGTTIREGSLEVGGAGRLGSGNYNGAIGISNNATFAFNSSAAQTLGGVISGAGGSLVKGSSGTLTLSAANTYSGGTTLNGGTLLLSNQNALQGSTLTMNGGGTLVLDSVAGTAFTLGGLAANNGGEGYDIGLTNSAGAGVNLRVGNNNASTSYGGVLSGSGTLTKVGAGVLTLTNANTYSGGTAIGGTVGGIIVSNGNALGSGSVTVASGASLGLTGNITVTNDVFGSGAGTAAGNGFTDTQRGIVQAMGVGTTSTITGNIYSTVAGGTNRIGVQNGSSLEIKGSILFTNSVAFIRGGANTGDYVILSNTNSWTQDLIVFGGSTNAGLRLGTNNALATNAGLTSGGSSGQFNVDLFGFNQTLASINITTTSTHLINNRASGTSTLTLNTASNAVSGSNTIIADGPGGGKVALVMSGSGTQTLQGASSYSGGTTINAGTLAISTNDALGIGVLTFASSGTGTLAALTNNVAITNAQSLEGNGTYNVGSGLTFTNGGVISGTGILTKTGAGSMVLTNANDYTGGTVIANGAINMDNANALGTSGNIDFEGGTLTYGSGITTDISDRIKSSARAVAIDSGANAITFNSAIDSSNVGGLSKAGAGTLTLNGVNTFTGNITNSAGTLQIGGAGQLGGGDFAGTITNVGGFAYNSSANQTLGGVISGAGSLTKGSSGTLTLSAANTYTGTTTVNNGQLNINNNTALGTGAFTIAGGSIDNTSGSDKTIVNAINLNADTTFVGSGNLTQTTGAVALNANRQITVSANTLSLGGLVSGAGFSITKLGSGTLALAGANNTFSGGLNVNAGQVTAAADNALGTGALSVSSSTEDYTIVDIGNFNQSVGAVSVGDNGFIRGGAGTLTGTSYSVNVAGTAGIGANLGGDSSGLTKSGDGVLYLFGSNSFGGGSILNGGSIVLNSANGLGTSGNITFGGGTLTYGSATTDLSGRIKNSTGTIALDLGANNVAFASVIDSSNTGGLRKSGVGTLTLSGSNSYTGDTLLNEGQININNDSALGSGAFTIAGGSIDNTSGAARTITNVLNINSDFTFVGGTNLSQTTGAVALNDNRTITVSANTLSLGGLISGAGYSITKAGAGSLTLAGANNAFGGGLNVTAGTLTAGAENALGSSAVNVTGGTLAIGNFNQSVGALSLGNAAITGGTGTLTATGYEATNSGAATISSILGGGGSLTKNNAGNLTLSGANTYSGGTTINAGTIILGNANALGTGTITLNLGRLQAGTITIANSLALGSSGSGTLSSTVQGQANAFGFSGALTGGTDSQLTISPTANNNRVLLLGDLGGYSGTIYVTNNADLSFGQNSANNLTNGRVVLSSGRITGHTGSDIKIGSLEGNAGTTVGTQYNGNGGLKITVGYLGLNTTYNGVISQTVGGTANNTFTKVGSGTQTLTGINTYTGATTVSGGALVIGGTGLLGGAGGNYASAIAIANGATFAYNSSANQTLSGVVSGTGAFTKGSSGTLTLNNAANTYTGPTTISEGTFEIGGAGRLNNGNYATAIGISNAAVLAVNSTANQTLDGVISGEGSLVKASSGTLTLSAANSYTGGTRFNAGSLIINNANALGTSGDLDFEGGTLVYGTGITTDLSGRFKNSGRAISINSGTNALTFASSIDESNTGGLSKSGASALTLSASNGYSGGTVIGGTAGGIIATRGDALGSGSITVASGTSLGLSGGITVTNDVYGTGNGSAATNGFTATSRGIIQAMGGGTSTFAGNIYSTVAGATNRIGSQDGSSLNITGSILFSNAVALLRAGSTPGDYIILSNTNNWQALQVFGGNTNSGIRLGINNALSTNAGLSPSSSNSLFNLDLNGFDQTLARLSNAQSASTNVIDNRRSGTTSTLTINTADGTSNNSGNTIIANGVGTVALVKSGAGTQTLTATNTYSGGTTVNEGTLAMASDRALGSGSVTVNGGTLDVSATNGIVGEVSLGNGTITGSGTLTGSSYRATNSGDATISASLAGGGGLTKTNAGTLTLSGANTYSGGTTVNNGTLSITRSNAIGTGVVTLNNNAIFEATGIGATTLANDFTVGAGTGIIRKTGTDTLTLAGNFNKTGSVLQFVGGSYNVTGKITGNSGSFNSDLLLSNAAVTLSGANNDYFGPTHVTAGSTITAGIANALPSSTVLNLGSADDAASVINSFNLNGNSVAIGGLNSAGSGTAQVYNSNSLSLATLTLNGTTNTTFDGSIGVDGANNIDLSVIGAQSLSLTGINGYTGITTIGNNSSINLGSSGRLSGTSRVTVNGGTLLLGAEAGINQINTNAVLELNGGTLSMGGNNSTRAAEQTFASLTLTGNSIIDFAALSGNSTLTFGSITGLVNGSTLSIWNWSDAVDNQTKLIDSSAGLGSSQLANISFYSGAGSGFLANGMYSGNEIVPDIVPVPEPGVVISALLLLGCMIYSFRTPLLRLAGR